MTALVLDSGGLSFLAGRTHAAAALIASLRRTGQWPPRAPTVVLVESLRGSAGTDARTNQFLKSCDVVESITQPLARRAALLRSRARTGSAIDAIVVVLAEPGGSVLTGDAGDIEALATQAADVVVVSI